MTQHPDPLTDTALEALLAKARTAPPAPLPPALQARLLADALAAQARVPARPGPLSRLRLWLADLGGLPGMAGMTAAGVAGLWIGLADPLPDTRLSGFIREGAASVSPALAALIDPGTETSPFDDFILID